MRMNMTMSMRFSKNLRRGLHADATPSEHRMRAPHSCITSSGSTSRPVSFNRENRRNAIYSSARAGRATLHFISQSE
jgi:hypothetical protein